MPIQKAHPPTLTSDGLTCFSPHSSDDSQTSDVYNIFTIYFSPFMFVVTARAVHAG